MTNLWFWVEAHAAKSHPPNFVIYHLLQDCIENALVGNFLTSLNRHVKVGWYGQLFADEVPFFKFLASFFG